MFFSVTMVNGFWLIWVKLVSLMSRLDMLKQIIFWDLYTKFAGNPCIAFGPSGSYDAGTVADAWVYEYHDVYYIGYTVSPTSSSPWQTAVATTTDWQTFTKLGVIVPRGDEFNTFRGAVTLIGDEYVFSYTTGGPSSGQYRLCVATQPVYQVPPSTINKEN